MNGSINSEKSFSVGGCASCLLAWDSQVQIDWSGEEGVWHGRELPFHAGGEGGMSNRVDGEFCWFLNFLFVIFGFASWSIRDEFRCMVDACFFRV